MVITSRTPEIAGKNKELVMKFLEDKGLELNNEKSKITNIKKGFDFLGFNFKRVPHNRLHNKETDQETVLIINCHQSFDKGVNKGLKTTIKKVINKDKSMVNIIRGINPVLRG